MESTVTATINDNDPIVNAIRNGKLVEVRWSELTADEQREANCNLFSMYAEPAISDDGGQEVRYLENGALQIEESNGPDEATTYICLDSAMVRKVAALLSASAR